MKSAYDIIWSEESKRNLSSIVEYLEINWTKKELGNFLKDLNDRVKLISSNPNLFPESFSNKNIRRSVLNKQTSIFYTVRENKILIISLFGNKQNPDKLKF